MRQLLSISAAVLVLCFCVNSAQASTPNLNELQLVAELPKELPQRVMGLAYDGEQLWATVYLGRGTYAKLNPEQYIVNGITRPSGLAWAQDALWISEFRGKIRHLPFHRV